MYESFVITIYDMNRRTNISITICALLLGGLLTNSRVRFCLP